ncbi:dihydrodipicolinate synthase [Eremomyces bilateralis CBS 781.70]|uniref:Dihydrodipicolinate synthase n=1 Tax=Eremomyces bilateralis CBS 781.70 TaxID=1392243 RepID=A0A6G1FRJ5_9PEZI|nr:dihydrodipicolinate synthase [Eremomyces bilateralis CBS 781.70]KAF1808346.1 dihydrodipicolinate synthase [Eremomyces bilateralis CBS 781.70]
MVASPPPGIFVPVPTFFVSRSHLSYNSANPPIDLAAQCAHALHLASNGIRGLVLLGSTGEAVHLTMMERDHVLKGVRKALEGGGFKGYPLIAGTASQSIEEVLLQLRQAADAGVQWGLCLAPGYFASNVSQEGIKQWFREIANKSPIPIMVYHYPGVSNNITVSPATMAELSQHPNIVGCKLSHGAVDDHALVSLNPKINHEQFRLFTGFGQHLLPVLSVGGAGAIDGLAGIFPKCVVRLYNLFEQGRNGDERVWNEMRALQFAICGGEKLIAKWGTIGIKEATSRIVGIGDRDGGRLPLQGGIPGGDAEWEQWKTVMDDLVAIEKSL